MVRNNRKKNIRNDRNTHWDIDSIIFYTRENPQLKTVENSNSKNQFPCIPEYCTFDRKWFLSYLFVLCVERIDDHLWT